MSYDLHHALRARLLFAAIQFSRIILHRPLTHTPKGQQTHGYCRDKVCILTKHKLTVNNFLDRMGNKYNTLGMARNLSIFTQSFQEMAPTGRTETLQETLRMGC